MIPKDEIIRSALKTARDWELQGNANWAARSYSTALLSMLGKVAESSSNAAEGVAQLESMDARKCMGDMLRSLQSLRQEIDSKKLPWAVIGGNYHLIVFSHLGTLFRETTAAAEFLMLANEPEVTRLSTKFWTFYGRALSSLTHGQVVELQQIKLKAGLEQSWMKYVQLMGALARGENPEECLREVSLSFGERNRDARIKDDQYEIEGSALHPVRWDFRKDAILLAVK